MSIKLSNIASITGGKITGPGEMEIDTLLVDSRKATSISAKSLFIALEGTRSDGHRYIGNLVSAGVRAFLVRNGYCSRPGFEAEKNTTFIEVDDTLAALQAIASYKRSLFRGTVIAITGSNGKTIVKEWLADILGNVAPVLRSPRSYNSQTGVPLSVWHLDDSQTYGIFEAGMSMPGEIARLEKIIKPDIGILTNIGEAHQENFSSVEEKIEEKLLLFRQCHTIIHQVDQPEVNRVMEAKKWISEKKLVSWSLRGENADILFKEEILTGRGARLKVKTGNETFSVVLHSGDRATIENSATVISALLTMGISSSLIRTHVEQLRSVEMRMEQKEGINGCTLIEDYYNSDPGSLAIALDFLKSQPANKRSVIISDFVQVAGDRRSMYAGVVEMLAKSSVDRVICVGESLMEVRDLFDDNALFFPDTEQLLRWFDPLLFRNETVLLKGARKFEFERLGELLQLKAHITRLEINLNKLLWNLNRLRSYLKEGTMTMAMVKAFAYGAGPREMSEWLLNNGVDYLAVAYTDEGVMLRNAGIGGKIMIMNPDPSAFATIIEHDLEPEIYSLDLLDQFIGVARQGGVTAYPVHIKCDTGMHRLGFMKHEKEELIGVLLGSKEVRVASVFSHLAASEDPELDRMTEEQVQAYTSFADALEDALGYSFTRHILNSSGVTRFPAYQFDMVRLGIGLFGVGDKQLPGAMSVLSFRTKVSQVKNVPPGDGIGYGLKDAADKEREIAVIPVGYADGLSRRLGRGVMKLWVEGKRAPVVGEVCMDMCMADVTGLKVKAGDNVEIFGDHIPVSELAELCNTIPHEIITAIPPRVKRVFLYE